jgi:hypothetical protein
MHPLTLAQAISAPMQNRAANTYWKGPIDASGTYGEITKVLSYEAINSKTGATMFASGKIGQGFQEVGFGGNQLIHDEERAKLLDALTPQIAKYAKEGNWVKALKRAYTVARMLDDIKALNDFKVLTSDDAGELKTVSEHLAAYNDDIVSTKGTMHGKLSAADSYQKGENLGHRIKVLAGVGPKAGVEMDKALGKARGADKDMRNNDAAHDIIHDKVLPLLEKELAGDTEFAKNAEAALRANGYLKDK